MRPKMHATHVSLRHAQVFPLDQPLLIQQTLDLIADLVVPLVALNLLVAVFQHLFPQTRHLCVAAVRKLLRIGQLFFLVLHFRRVALRLLKQPELVLTRTLQRVIEFDIARLQLGDFRASQAALLEHLLQALEGGTVGYFHLTLGLNVRLGHWHCKQCFRIAPLALPRSHGLLRVSLLFVITERAARGAGAHLSAKGRMQEICA